MIFLRCLLFCVAAVYAFQGTIFRSLMSIKYRNQQKLETIQSRRFFSRKSGTKTFKMSNTDANDSEISKPLLTCSELFNSILRDKVPVYKNETEAFLIINKPSETMLHSIFDVDIDTYVSKVLSSTTDADSRLKPLFAVVTGMGRGKTRMLVEMQRKFNEKPNVFCLALTFNSNWTKFLKIPDDIKSPYAVEFQYALNVVARIISMNYHISFDDTVDLLVDVVGKLKVKSSTASDFIHECVKYIIAQYRANGQQIDQFVLLVDESVAIQTELDSDNKLDIHQTLRDCLLTRPMIMDDGLHLKVDLVMSGLTVTPMGRTTSRRVIIPLTTPEALTVSKIWNLWLPKYIPESVYKALDNDNVTKFRMELLFAIAAPIPRCVQYVVTEARDYFNTPRDSNMLNNIDSKALEAFFSKSYEDLEEKYGSMRDTLMLPKHARAVLLEEEIKLDEDLTEMIQNSFLINSLPRISKVTTLVPKTSILSLKIFTKDKPELYWRSIRVAIEKLEELFSEVPNKVKLGQYLEAAVRGLINARLYVLMQLAAEAKFQNKESLSVTISELLLLTDRSSIKGASLELQSRIENDFLVPPYKVPLAEVFLRDSYISMQRFLSDANMAPAKAGHILELKPVPDQECFDYGLLFSSGIDGKPFAVFIDAKSGRQRRSEFTDTKIVSETGLPTSLDVNMNSFQGDFDFADLPKNGKQASHLLKIANTAKKWDPAKVTKGSMLEALQEDSYLYIYVNTTESASSFAVNDHVMQLGETDSKCLLSFLLDSYRLVRTASTRAEALDAKERNAERNE